MPADLIQPAGYQLFLSSKMWSPVPGQPGVATRVVAAVLPVCQQPDPSYLHILIAATACLSVLHKRACSASAATRRTAAVTDDIKTSTDEVTTPQE